MTKSEIITATIAGYGAVLSTIVFAKQLVSDRAKVKLEVLKDREIAGDPSYQGVTLVTVRAVNRGRRPLTITQAGAVQLYPHKNFAFIDTSPRLPCEITEGKFIDILIDQAGLAFPLIDYWAVWDSRGGVHKAQEAAWFKHWKSILQRKLNR